MDKRKLIIGIVGIGGGILGLSYYMKKREEQIDNTFSVSGLGEKARDMVNDVTGGVQGALGNVGAKLKTGEVSDQSKAGLGAIFPPLAAYFGGKKAQKAYKELTPAKQAMVKDTAKGAIFPPAALFFGIKNYWRGYKSLPKDSKTKKLADTAHGGAASILPPLALFNSIKSMFNKPAKDLVTNTKTPGEKHKTPEEQAMYNYNKYKQMEETARKKMKQKQRTHVSMWEHASSVRELLAKKAKKQSGTVVVKPTARRPKGGGGLVVSGGVRR